MIKKVTHLNVDALQRLEASRYHRQILLGSDAGVSCSVVIAVVNALRSTILLTSNCVPILRSEVTVIGSSHLALFRVQLRLVGVRRCSASRCDLAVGNSFVDASLLAGVAGFHRVTLVISGALR